MKTPWLFFMSAIMAAGCATGRVGMTRAELVEQIGVPDRSVKIDDSTEIWEYNPRQTYTIKNGIVTDYKRKWGISVSVNDDAR